MLVGRGDAEQSDFDSRGKARQPHVTNAYGKGDGHSARNAQRYGSVRRIENAFVLHVLSEIIEPGLFPIGLLVLWDLSVIGTTFTSAIPWITDIGHLIRVLIPESTCSDPCVFDIPQDGNSPIVAAWSGLPDGERLCMGGHDFSWLIVVSAGPSVGIRSIGYFDEFRMSIAIDVRHDSVAVNDCVKSVYKMDPSAPSYTQR